MSFIENAATKSQKAQKEVPVVATVAHFLYFALRSKHKKLLAATQDCCLVLGVGDDCSHITSRKRKSRMSSLLLVVPI